MSEKKKKKNLPEGYLAVYRPPLFAQIMAFGIMAFLVLVMGAAVTQNPDIQGNLSKRLFGFLAAAVVVGMLFIFVVRDKLIITEQGLVWWQQGFKYQISWDQLHYFDWGSRENEKDAIWGIRTRSQSLVPLSHYLPVPGYGALSQEVDLNEFLQTEAGAYFYQYAPHLFDELDSVKKKQS